MSLLFPSKADNPRTKEASGREAHLRCVDTKNNMKSSVVRVKVRVKARGIQFPIVNLLEAKWRTERALRR